MNWSIRLEPIINIVCSNGLHFSKSNIIQNIVSYKFSHIEKSVDKPIHVIEFEVGQKLPVESSKMCLKFSVSRTMVREAIKALEDRGLINIRKGSGTYVIKPTITHAVNSTSIYFIISNNQDLIKIPLRLD